MKFDPPIKWWLIQDCTCPHEKAGRLEGRKAGSIFDSLCACVCVYDVSKQLGAKSPYKRSKNVYDLHLFICDEMNYPF